MQHFIRILLRECLDYLILLKKHGSAPLVSFKFSCKIETFWVVFDLEFNNVNILRFRLIIASSGVIYAILQYFH